MPWGVRTRERGRGEQAMRLAVTGTMAIAFLALLSACARVDPEEAAERALVGAVAGTALGTGIGAAFAINPGIGAVIGAESGAAIGAAVGAVTAQPLPDYKPVALPAGPPAFYDGWPPRYTPPPPN